MKSIKTVFLLFIFAFIAIQLVPVNRDNPAGRDTFNAPLEVKRIAARSCYDCHSNKTHWPWYAHIAPVSWLVISDVHQGRRKLNLSDWGSLTPQKQRSKREEMCEEIQGNDMPLPKYLKMHPDARLNDKEKKLICDWAQSKGK